MTASLRQVFAFVLAVSWLSVGCSSSSKKIQVGDGCTLNSDCHSPLSCSYGKCHDTCQETRDCPTGQSCARTPEGSVCLLPIESDCQSTNGVCNTGLVCASDQRCRVACVGAADCLAGQMCAQGVCADSSNVDISGLLKQGAGVGATCAASPDCNAPLTCVMGTCHYSCTSTSVCPMSQSCVKAFGVGVCQQAVEAGCDSTTGSGCTAGLVCASDNRCRASCRSASDCTPGQVCTSGVCADPSDLINGQLTPKAQPKLDAGAPAPDATRDGYTSRPDASSTIPTGGTSGSPDAGETGAKQDAGTNAGDANSSSQRDAATVIGGYFRNDDWHGYAWVATASGTGTTVSPTNFDNHVAGEPYCVSGSMGTTASNSAFASIGFDINVAEGTTATDLKGSWTPKATSPDGLLLNVTNTKGTPMNVNIGYDPDRSDYTFGVNLWCAQLTEFNRQVLIPWSAFNSSCWTTGGKPYAGQPLTSVSVVANPSNTTQPTPFAFCVNTPGHQGQGTSPPSSGTVDAGGADRNPDTGAPDVPIKVTDDGGGSSTVTAGCGKVTTKRYFCDDFEGGLDNWHHATEGWGLTDKTYQSPGYSVTDSPNGNYPAGGKSEIIMVSSVELTGAVAPILTFWHRLDIASYYNGAHVDSSLDGGTTWSVLTTFTGTNNTSVWSFQQLSLASLAGKRVKLRFRLENTSSSASYLGDGWYLDDLEIREADVAPIMPTDGRSRLAASTESSGCSSAIVGTRYFCEDFEAGLSNWLVATEGWNTVTSTSQSPSHSVTDSPNGNYPAGAKSEITMVGSVDLASAASAVLTFWHRLSIASYYNTVHVDSSLDGGTTWSALTTFTGTNNTSVWSFQQLSLASLTGKKCKLRFRLENTSASSSYQGDGWYVDDIKIRENEFVPIPSDLALCTSQNAGAACNAADMCRKTCGTDGGSGSKSLTCVAGKFVESACTYPGAS